MFFCLCITQVQAQGLPAKFPKLENDLVAMRVYEKDTSAAAVIISDYGYTYFTFNKGFKLMFERQVRIKILKKSGYDWANVSVPYFQLNAAKEKIYNVRGYTYNMVNGKVVKHKLDAEGMHDEQRTENWHAKKFTMPNVKEGSVIEYAYTVSSDFMYNLRGWEFQKDIPVEYSDYKVRIPEYFDYRLDQQGYLGFDVARRDQGIDHFFVSFDGARALDQPATVAIKANNITYHWVVKDAPALRREKYITTLRDYQSKIDFELQSIKFPERPAQIMTGSWEQVTKDILAAERFGVQLSRKGFFKNEVAAIVAKHAKPEERMEAVHDLVKSTMKWNRFNSFMSSGPIRKAYENRTGSSGDINLLLIAMLRDAGLDAGAILLSTRENGRAPMSPMLSKFNYVIAHVIIDGKEHLLDATDPLLPVGMLPVHCLNGKGRLVKQEDQRWVSLIPTNTDNKFFNANLTIAHDGGIVGVATESSGGYHALQLRKVIKEEGEAKFAEKISKEVGNFKVEKPTFTNIGDLTKTLNVSYTLKASGNGQSNDVIYLNPMMGHGEKENPFKLESREYPVDLGVPIDHTYICRFMLPEGYELEEMPKGAVVTLPENGGKFMYMIEKQDNAIQVVSKISMLRPVYFAPEYPYLKEFYNQIVAKHAEQIVLRKKSQL